ncbi:hypothetical protein [Actinomadura sp. WMMB 499]|uniref:Gp37-like protein n=1 Tax=Actinomadura sp. WMMB 499 TaxID=1219491 RepID=UPI00159D45C2|nr:hypothetical protein [Actinomadura sp. WMMB 499]
MLLIGEVDRFISFESIGRHLDVGSWTLTLPASSPQAHLIKPGRGIALFLDSSPDQVAFGGPIRSIKLTKNRETGGRGLLTVSGVCDNTVVRERLGRIDPTTVYAREDEVSRKWVPTVHDGVGYRTPRNSGEFIWGLLVANLTIPVLSSVGDTSRRIRYLDMPTTCPAVLRAMPADEEWKRYPIKLSSIEDAVWDLARLVGLSVRFLYNAHTGLVEPRIEPSRDLSDDIVFDELAGNLAGFEVTVEAPAFTRLFMAGEAPEADDGRRYYEYWRSNLWNPPGWVDFSTPGSTPAQWSDPYWGRKGLEVEWNTTAESYLDVRESDWGYQSDPADPGAALDPPVDSDERRRFDRQRIAAFVENSQKGLVTFEAVDTDTCRYGRDYQIGDTVRMLLDTSNIPESMTDADGVIRQQVREVRIACKADEMWIIEPTIGSDETSSTPYVYRKLRQLQRQVEATNNRT